MEQAEAPSQRPRELPMSLITDTRVTFAMLLVTRTDVWKLKMMVAGELDVTEL